MEDQIFNPKRIIEIYTQFVQMQMYISVEKASNGGRHVIMPLIAPHVVFWEACRIIGRRTTQDGEHQVLICETDIEDIQGGFKFKLFLCQKLNTMIEKYGGYERVKGQDIIIVSEGKKEPTKKGKKEYTDMTMVMQVK